MTISTGQILDIINSFAPWNLADSWDNVGLLLGSRHKHIKSVLCALEVTPDIIDEAQKSKTDLLIVHHPLIFHPLARIDDAGYPGSLVAELIRSNISLIAVHTNLDKSPAGTNFTLACMLALDDIFPLIPESPRTRAYKFVVFVPEQYEQRIIDAIARGGGGVIGDYSHCTFRVQGQGGFRPSKDASPFIGTKDIYEEVSEYRIEALVDAKSLSRVVNEVLDEHPYEEPAYDIYPLEATPVGMHGIGCLGSLKKATTLQAFAAKVKRVLHTRAVSLVEGSPRKKIRNVAICTGAADSVLREMMPGTADVILAGEINHHTALATKIHGLNVILAGHYETEVVGMNRLAEILAANPVIKKYAVSVRNARHQSSPFSPKSA